MGGSLVHTKARRHGEGVVRGQVLHCHWLLMTIRAHQRPSSLRGAGGEVVIRDGALRLSRWGNPGSQEGAKARRGLVWCVGGRTAIGCSVLSRVPPPRHCEARSDVAIHGGALRLSRRVGWAFVLARRVTIPYLRGRSRTSFIHPMGGMEPARWHPAPRGKRPSCPVSHAMVRGSGERPR